MKNFKIEKTRIESITSDLELVVFDLVTEHGRVELSEYFNVDSEGNFESLEFIDSNIRCHLEDELCSVFDMSEKPSLMPGIDYVPFAEILEAVEQSIEA